MNKQDFMNAAKEVSFLNGSGDNIGEVEFSESTFPGRPEPEASEASIEYIMSRVIEGIASAVNHKDGDVLVMSPESFSEYRSDRDEMYTIEYHACAAVAKYNDVSVLVCKKDEGVTTLDSSRLSVVDIVFDEDEQVSVPPMVSGKVIYTY